MVWVTSAKALKRLHHPQMLYALGPFHCTVGTPVPVGSHSLCVCVCVNEQSAE